MSLEIQDPFYHRSFSLYNLYNARLDQSAKKKKHVLCSEPCITKLYLLEQHWHNGFQSRFVVEMFPLIGETLPLIVGKKNNSSTPLRITLYSRWWQVPPDKFQLDTRVEKQQPHLRSDPWAWHAGLVQMPLLCSNVLVNMDRWAQGWCLQHSSNWMRQCT